MIFALVPSYIPSTLDSWLDIANFFGEFSKNNYITTVNGSADANFLLISIPSNSVGATQLAFCHSTG